jgi:hypothetical protein
MHNPSVRRIFVAFFIVVFATLATTDGVACPDGCQSATSPTAADHCNDSGICFFCTGAVVTTSALPVTPFMTQLPAPDLPVVAVPACSIEIPDHPPRRA